MKFDRSDVTSLIVIACAAGFGVVATGSMALRATDASRVVVEVRGPDRVATVRPGLSDQIRAEVAGRIRTELGERLDSEVERMTVRPAIYVDGVLVEPGSIIGDLDPREIRSVTVLRGENQIRIESDPR